MTQFRAGPPPLERVELCWGARAGSVACTRCVEACPVGAVSVDPRDGIRITGECLGCDACVATCPTGALSSSQAELRRRFRAPPAGDAVTLSCHRRRAGSAGDRVSMHCLARLDAAGVIEVAAESGFRAVVADLESCADCPAGAVAPAIGAVFAEAAAALADFGVPAARRPAVTGDTRAPASAIVERRAFLRRAVADRRPVRASNARMTPPSAAKIPPLQRRRLWSALRRAAAAFGRATQAAAFFEVEVGESCAGHGVCASICPTGALRLADDGGTRSLLFLSLDCIGCGACVGSCPTRTVRVGPATGEVARRRVLAQRTLRACRACDEMFIAAEDADVCPACAKERGLFAEIRPVSETPSARDPSLWRNP